MRFFRLLLLMGIAMAFAWQFPLYAQTDKKEDEDARRIQEMVENKDFRIDVTKAIPMSGPLVNLTNTFFIKIDESTVVSALPFYGRAYSVPYGGGEGLNFEGTVSDYTFEKNKKGTLSIEFKTKSKDDYIQYRILLYPNGSALINVQPTHRQSISFQGNLKSDN